MATSILVVEDDQYLAELIAAYLTKQNYSVAIHSRGDTAEAVVLATQPELVILDITLPGRDGFEICRTLRPVFSGHILMMTARDDEIDEILGLELGADDYLSKPVDPRRLLARVRALQRRFSHKTQNHQQDTSYYRFGQFHINEQTREASLGGVALDLTTAEFDLLWLLASNAGKVLSRDWITNTLRGIGFDGLDRSIDARISRLRKRLNDDPEMPARIKTVRGKGYLFSRRDWE